MSLHQQSTVLLSQGTCLVLIIFSGNSVLFTRYSLHQLDVTLKVEIEEDVKFELGNSYVQADPKPETSEEPLEAVPAKENIDTQKPLHTIGDNTPSDDV